MDERILMIRDEERKYHEACYEQHQLFEPGSWLNKPVITVMDTLKAFDAYEELSVLDLGSGVGRNSIPIAQSLKSRSGQVVCVDILEQALEKLKEYSDTYGVNSYISTHLSDIGDYEIKPEGFDYIITVSSLEHVASEQIFTDVIRKMVCGTKVNGINCLIVNTNCQEIDLLSGSLLEPMMEVNLATEKAANIFAEAYQGWDISYTTVKQLEFTIERNERPVLLKSDCITYVARRVN
ncbi:methyltransferase [Paenibacillus marchantiophytorum]|uniref:Methyltransferase n=1 Tax=Paenibacillus marchantiophytorum TaxID=1619310 RepID=A0ABQ1FHM8_9BACL|nr:class I SAM-dependent methyltransferase [Paenibacillus marchantiophytorum]GGA10741.1 methyltransferase [Paenibacillus marchantiophytorum]